LATEARNNPVLVIDVGTGFTKMGFSGNVVPQFIIPTQLCYNTKPKLKEMADLDFYIGEEAVEKAVGDYQNTFPMKHGQVENWDNMERFWEHCFFKYLRTEPENHFVMLTEPPLNQPENREFTAEIMFETFSVAGIYIAVQAVLALAASWTAKKSKDSKLAGTLTGTVVDSGDGVTHVIPISDGYVIGSSIKHIPLAGRDITNFIQQFIREREEGKIPPEEALASAQRVKEEFGYVCSDLSKEFNKYDSEPSKYFTTHTTKTKTGKPYTFDIGYEKFLGPELFFNPEIFTSQFTVPLPDVVDNVIQSCPIDCRRPLYKNIVLSGGSTTFQHFGRRLERDIQVRTKERIDRSRAISKGLDVKDIEVNVISHAMQKYAVWFGGSMLGATSEFYNVCISKADYDEKGPGVARHSKVFGAMTL